MYVIKRIIDGRFLRMIPGLFRFVILCYASFYEKHSDAEGHLDCLKDSNYILSYSEYKIVNIGTDRLARAAV